MINNKSLVHTTLLKMALYITAAITITSFISYQYIFHKVEEQELRGIRKYVLERAERERNIFKLTEDNQAVIKADMLKRFEEMGNTDPVETFNKTFKRYPDGVWRMHKPAKKGDKVTTAFIDESLTINADLRIKMVTFKQLSDLYGPVWNHLFPNLYIFSELDNMETIYWPSQADWHNNTGPDYDISKEEWAYTSNEKNNPQRQPAWTGLYWDSTVGIWMVSCATPVYIDNRHICSIGQDIYLSQLIERSINDHLEGAYNIIFRKDGRLIAHPEQMQQNLEQEGLFNILDSGDDRLKRIYKHITENPEKNIIKLKQDNIYLAVAQIKEPQWIFVVAYPMEIVSNTAFKSAMTVLAMGSISLFIVICLLYLILRNQVGTPLHKLVDVTVRITSGESNVRLPTERRDEFGRLAQSFNMMVERVEELIMGLRQRVNERDKLLKAIESKNEELQAIVYVSSHDLRSPLVNIQGFSGELKHLCQDLSELINLDSIDDKTKTGINAIIQEDIPEALEYISTSSTKMSNLLSGLLQVSRVGTVDMKIESLDMNILIANVVDCMQFRINESEASVIIENLCTCQGDTDQVNQVFSNLIGNALKYRHPDRKPQINIKCKTENNTVIYCVTDNGIGIKKDYHKIIFEIFHQLDPNNHSGGTGLGLTITKRILNRLDGDITLESEPDKGSTFQVYLPKA